MSTGIPPRTRAEQIAYNAEVMRQQELDRPNVRLSRSRRRMAVVATYSVLAVMLVTFTVWSWGPTDRSTLWPVGPLGLLALSICLLVIDHAVGGLTRKDSSLDERERAERDHATAVAYRALTLLIGFGSVYTISASLSRRWLPFPTTLHEALPFGIALIWLVTTLPRAILAWTVPDPDPDADT